MLCTTHSRCLWKSALEYLDTDKGKVRAKAYDLVLNGIELCSGSIRITDPELQERMFRLLGLTDKEIEEKFGFLVDAYKYAAPPARWSWYRS